ncbi:heterokaryon incompatibility protein-domain-containing protein, partial [Bisporella sp. PMI_857]
YAALSYCWGSTEFVTLSKSNISSFKAGIDINTLPETIHDAIQVARSLRIPYLWVDSLCIIQDSLEDKAEEISKMSEIYQNATITLSAASSKDSFQGILSKREDVESAIQPKSKGLGTVLLSLDPYCGYITRNFTDSPISQRAWTLQESLLSPRLLVFDTGPLQWKCLQRSSIYGLDSPSKNNLMSRALADPLLDSDLRHKFLAIRHPEGSYVRKDAQSVCAWLEIVTTYTSRAMKNAEDRLLALSGIAAQWKQITGWTYISGIWVEIFPNCLQWRYDFSRDAAGSNSISRPGRYRAPSWSWASIN